MFYVEFFRALEKAEVRYLLVGAVAMEMHGIPRSTSDIDLFVKLERDNVGRFLGVMQSFAYGPVVPVAVEDLGDEAARSRWRNEKNMLVLSFRSDVHPAVPIDVFISEPFPFDEAYGRRRRTAIRGTGVEISVVGLDDLIAMKWMAGRRQDLDDLDALLRKKQKEKDKGKDKGPGGDTETDR